MGTHGTTDSRKWLLIFATLAVFLIFTASLVSVAYLAYQRMQRQPRLPVDPGVSHLDKLFGQDTVDGIAEEGISGVETSHIWGGENYRWTLGHAKFVVPLGDHTPKYLFVRLGVPVARKMPLRIEINGKVLFDEKVAMTGEMARTFDVSEMNLGKDAVIEIISDTFVPAVAHKNSTDPRNLGVCVRGVMLVSAAQTFVDVPLGVRSVPGVFDEGFFHQEHLNGQPFRWTNGAARLDVPIGTHKPTWLDVTLEPPTRPGNRVLISVNGRNLFDDKIKTVAGVWTAQLPLEGVELGNNARIEIKTPTFVPAQVIKGSTDGRTLGVRVKRLMLVADPEKKPKD